jgi:hypothetical protein
LCAPVIICGTQQAWSLEYPSSSITAITQPLPIDRMEHSSCPAIWPPRISSSTWQCFQALSQYNGNHFTVCLEVVLFPFQSHLSSNIFMSTVASTHTLSKNSWLQVSFSPSAQELDHCSLFYMDNNLCHFRVICADAICQVKHLQPTQNKWEYLTISLM